MSKLLALAVAATAAMLLATQASADRPGAWSIVVHAVATPTFLDPTASCPAGGAREQVSIGWFEFCFETFTFDATGGASATGTATFHVPRGAIETTLTLGEVATSTGVIQADSGTIFGGTGSYRGATGTLSGGGPIVFDATGTPHPDLSLTLALGGDRGVPFSAVDSGSAAIVATTPPLVQTADNGRGTGTHLGRFTLVAGERVNLVTGAVTSGFYTLAGANGDSISGTYSGQAPADLTGYLVSGPVTGGTGRFAGATGFLVWRGVLDPATFTFSDVITGWISSTGSGEDNGDE